MIDPATGWFEICSIPENEFNSTRVSQLFNRSWLARYPRPTRVLSDNGSEFKKHFKALLKEFGIKRKTITPKNPQANSIIERIHGVINNMLRVNDLENHDFDPVDPWGDLLANIAWALRSLFHTTTGATPGQLVFGRDMLFDIKYAADWETIRDHKYKQILKNKYKRE